MSASIQDQKPLYLKVLINSFLVLWLLMAAFPFLWTAWGSFKVEADFFSKADWTNALTGVMTIAESGEYFTTDGYYGAWVQ